MTDDNWLSTNDQWPIFILKVEVGEDAQILVQTTSLRWTDIPFFSWKCPYWKYKYVTLDILKIWTSAEVRETIKNNPNRIWDHQLCSNQLLLIKSPTWSCRSGNAWYMSLRLGCKMLSSSLSSYSLSSLFWSWFWHSLGKGSKKKWLF